MNTYHMMRGFTYYTHTRNLSLSYLRFARIRCICRRYHNVPCLLPFLPVPGAFPFFPVPAD